MKSFDVPIAYRSPLITAIKQHRKQADKLKKDFTPTSLQFDTVEFLVARHFGFCYGVENAIEIAFRTVAENKGKRIFLLSEMIHNPQVNADLQAMGVQFLQDTYGKQLISIDTLTADDVVIIPAFGTTLAMEEQLKKIGIAIEKYNTTCPFVEKVWNRSEAIAKKGYTIVVHGKPTHEETRATFSHSAANAPTVVVKDMNEAIELSKYITGEYPIENFSTQFAHQYSNGFDAKQDLQRIGVVNQTTMLAEDTQAIADFLKTTMINKYGADEIKNHFADTRDTLCYATNDNQTAVKGMLEAEADLAIVVGGYNSSNTSHLVELCELKLPTYYINSEECLVDDTHIKHFDFHKKIELSTAHYLPKKQGLKIMITSGASCPDALVEKVMQRLLTLTGSKQNIHDLIVNFNHN